MPKKPLPINGDHKFTVAPAVSASIRRLLNIWYGESRRDLPWRRTCDPYYIWISEVMLQQTQVKTVKPYYRRFINRFPDVFSLARADLQTVLKGWEGLGYYSRARSMHKAAGIIADEGGRFPESWEGVRQLPGIGDYIASAIVSIAYGKPYAVVDGNVKRVLARLFLLSWPVNQVTSHRRFQDVANQLLDRQHSGDHNQAMMELGALVCKPRKPLCHSCPIAKHCRALASDGIQSFPQRTQRAPLPERHVVVGVVKKKGRWLLVQRAEQGLLGGLWEFPGGAVEGDEDPAKICERQIKTVVNLDVVVDQHLITVRHTYTHFKLHMDVYQCRWMAGRIYLRGPADFKWMIPKRVLDLPLHGAMHKALESLAYTNILGGEIRVKNVPDDFR
jgi:A/G-specific adenine glycosylase